MNKQKSNGRIPVEDVIAQEKSLMSKAALRELKKLVRYDKKERFEKVLA